MDKKANILVLHNDLAVRSHLEILLGEMGHHIVGFAENAIDALVMFSTKNPDLVLTDTKLLEALDGIDLIKKLNEIRRTPVLLLASHAETEFLKKSRANQDVIFVNRPIDRTSLEKSIAQGMENIVHQPAAHHPNRDSCKDALYTRVGNKLKKIYIYDIEYIEVDGKYCTIHLGPKHVNCKISLKEIVEMLPAEKFVQVSRNFVINMDCIEDIDMYHFTVKLTHSEIPISRIYKDALFERMKII